jgi:hypothetical protein
MFLTGSLLTTGLHGHGQHFGTPTDEEKRAFTRVLQGHIAIDSTVFPNGTTGKVSSSRSYCLRRRISRLYYVSIRLQLAMVSGVSQVMQ